MSPEEKHKINVWIPESLWNQIEKLGYDSPTKATIAAYEAFAQKESAGNEEEIKNLQEALKCTQEEARENQEVIRKYKEITVPKLEKQIEEAQWNIKDLEENLRTAPNPIEFAQLHTKSEELEKHNQTLKEELEKTHQDKEIIQNHYDNYMRQMQTLINQKTIEAPGKKKRWWKFW